MKVGDSITGFCNYIDCSGNVMLHGVDKGT